MITPAYYKNSYVMQSVYNALSDATDFLDAEIKLTEEQCFVLSSDRDLYKHEYDVGLERSYIPDIQKRRSWILIRLRGANTTTVKLLRDTVNSFIDGSVDIIEHYEKYSFTIAITFNRDEEYYSHDIWHTVNEIKPAHLSYTINAKFPLIPIYTKNTASMPLVDFHTAFHNYGFLLNGWKILDGTWYLGGRQLLNGGYSLDGSWLLEDRFMWFRLQNFKITIPIIRNNRFFQSYVGFNLAPIINTEICKMSSFNMAVSIENKQLSCELAFKVMIQFKNNCSLKGTIIIDSRYNLDGTVDLDGSRKLNADIIEEEI